MTVKTYPIERDEILIPHSDGYRKYPLLTFLGANFSILSGRRGLGMGQVRFITASSPYQHGVSVQAMRWQPRIIQLMINQSLSSLPNFWNQRERLLELLRPTRAFITTDKLIDPFIYRKWLPSAGSLMHGSDMIVTNGDDRVYSAGGAFMHHGGLDHGHGITIEGSKYIVQEVQNDSELTLTVPYPGGTLTGADFHYRQYPRYRDINFILQAGLEFEETQDSRPHPHGYQEVLRLICHDPFWRGREQERIWELPDVIGDLLFDDEGAWFGVEGVSGRWIFNPEYINETIGVVYRGHDVARPQIIIVGPAEYPSITNITTGIGLNLVYDVQPGEQVLIDIDKLSVINNFGDNLLGYLRGNLSGFGLVPEPAASEGINLIAVTFGKASQASSARLRWRNLYIGI